MKTMKQYLWVGALALGIGLVALGGFFVFKGFEAREMVRAGLAEQEVVTGKDAAIPGVPVLDAKTAQAEANVLKLHTLGRYGPYTKMSRDDPNRDTYLKGLTMQNSLQMAVLAFGVADLAMGTGAVVFLLGVATLGIQVPALYWMREPTREAAWEPRRQPSREPAEALT